MFSAKLAKKFIFYSYAKKSQGLKTGKSLEVCFAKFNLELQRSYGRGPEKLKSVKAPKKSIVAIVLFCSMMKMNFKWVLIKTLIMINSLI